MTTTRILPELQRAAKETQNNTSSFERQKDISKDQRKEDSLSKPKIGTSSTLSTRSSPRIQNARHSPKDKAFGQSHPCRSRKERGNSGALELAYNSHRPRCTAVFRHSFLRGCGCRPTSAVCMTARAYRSPGTQNCVEIGYLGVSTHIIGILKGFLDLSRHLLTLSSMVEVGKELKPRRVPLVQVPSTGKN